MSNCKVRKFSNVSPVKVVCKRETTDVWFPYAVAGNPLKNEDDDEEKVNRTV